MAFAVCALAAFCYWLGGRRPVRLIAGGRRWRGREWRTTAFFAGCVLLALILSSPIDAWVRERFYLRTVQLILIVMVVAPLLVVGAPWPRVARVLGHFPRGTSIGSRWIAALAFVLFNGALVLAYLPPVYQVTAESGILRETAQLLLTLIAVFFWSQVIAQPPGRCALSHVERVAFLVGSTVLIRMIGVVIGFASAPFYNTSLFDQQIAAGELMVPGVLTDLIVLTVCLYLWLGQDDRKEAERFDTGGRPAPVARVRPLTGIPTRTERFS